MNRGLVGELTKVIDSEHIHIEAMDERRFSDDKVLRQQLIDNFKLKYSQKYPPSLVIVTDDAALDLVLSLADWLKETPVLFLGVNFLEKHNIQLMPNITGIREGHSIEQNLDLIQDLMPDVEKVLVIGGLGSFGQFLSNEARRVSTKPKYEALDIEIFDDFVFKTMFTRLSELNTNTAVLFLAVSKDRDGEYFSYGKFLPQMSEISGAPIFTMWATPTIGKGTLGGYMNEAYPRGVEAGKMAVRILSGETTSEVAVKDEEFKALFDYRQMSRFGLKSEDLPSNAEVRFKPLTFYERNWLTIVTTLVILLVSASIIAILGLNIRRRVSAEKRLAQTIVNMDKTIKAKTEDLAKKNEKLTQLSKDLESEAKLDALTGMHNRRYFESKYRAFFERHCKTPDSLTVAMIDIDYFKRVNDNFGHQIGDRTLISVGCRLDHHVRPQDILARWGGEEFVVLFANTCITDAKKVCERIRLELAATKLEVVGKVTVSIGLASNNLNDNHHSLLNRADEELYNAKANGRNAVMPKAL